MEQLASPAVGKEENESSFEEPANFETPEEVLYELDQLHLSTSVSESEKAVKLSDLLKNAISIAINVKDDEKENSASLEAEFCESHLVTIDKIVEQAEAENINLFAFYLDTTIFHQLCANVSPQQFHRLVKLIILQRNEYVLKIKDNREQKDTALHIALKKNKSLLPETIDLLATQCFFHFTLKNNRGDNILHLASKQSSVPMLERVVRYYSGDLNSRNRGGNTALHHAARHGHSEVLQYLLSQKGVNVHAKSNRRETAIFSLFFAPVDNFVKNLNILVNAGADINSVDRHGRTILFHVVFAEWSKEVTQEILKLGCNLHSKDNLGRSLLHTCVQKDKIEFLKYFVDLGLKVNSKESEMGRSALHLAAAAKNMNAFECLVSNKGDLNLKDKQGDTPLSLIFKSENEMGRSALHFAAVTKNMNAFECLVSNGGDVNLKDNHGDTPLSLIFNSETEDADLSLSVIRMLIKHKVKLDSKFNSIENLLKLATKMQMTKEEKKRIIDLVVDLSFVNEEGQSLLHSMTTVGNAMLMKHLISKGANVNERDAKGRTPFHLCVDLTGLPYVNMVHFLSSHNANINATDSSGSNVLLLAAKSGKTRKQLERLVSYGAKWDATDGAGNTIFHILAEEGNVSALRYFLSFGANVNAVNKLGETPLHSVINAKKKFIPIVELLVESGVNLYAVDSFGRTAFSVAIIAERSSEELLFMQRFYYKYRRSVWV